MRVPAGFFGKRRAQHFRVLPSQGAAGLRPYKNDCELGDT